MPETIEGLAELKQQIDALPRDVTLALRAVAWQSSRRIQARAKQILRSKIHGHGKNRLRTADAIVVIEEADRKQFVVTVENPEQPNLGLWLERGTIKMIARPFMRPAGDEETPRYRANALKAAAAVADRLERI